MIWLSFLLVFALAFIGLWAINRRRGIDEWDTNERPTQQRGYPTEETEGER